MSPTTHVALSHSVVTSQNRRRRGRQLQRRRGACEALASLAREAGLRYGRQAWLRLQGLMVDATYCGGEQPCEERN